MEQLSKAFGVDFWVFESYEKNGKRMYVKADGTEASAPNGFYDENGIHIDLNAGKDGRGVMLYTLAHELTHHIRKNSPGKFKAFADLVMKNYGRIDVSADNLVQEQIAKAKRNGRDIGYDEAYEEVIADSMEGILSDGKVLQLVNKLQETDASLGEKVRKWFADAAEKIRSIVEAYKNERPDSTEGKMVANMKEILPQLEELYAEGLADTRGTTVTDGDEGAKNAAKDGGVKYQIRNTIKMSWEDQIRGLLYDGKRIRRNDTLVVGNVASFLSSDGVSSVPLAIPQNVITKAMSGKDISHSINRGKLLKLKKGIENAPIVIVNPDRNAIVYITNVKQGGYPILAAFDMDADFDGDRVHKATSIHTQIDVQTLLEQLSEKATIYVQNKNELETVGATNNLRGLSANIKFIDEIVPRSETTVNKKFSMRDSDGNDLTVDQAEYFRNSKVRDKDGNLLVMYHGTPQGGFTKFRSGSYFTENPEYAAVYQSPGASMLSHKKGADNPQSYQVYLNIEKPFDTRNPKERKIFMQEYYRKYGTGAPLSDSGLPDWTDGMDLQEFIEDMGYDYDGLILDEGATGGYGEEVKSRGLSYVTFNPEQVKNVDNKSPTSDPDIRYSDRDQNVQEANRILQKQNDELKNLVSELREIVRLQGRTTNGTVYTRGSIEAAGRKLMRMAGAKGDVTELSGILSECYSSMAEGSEDMVSNAKKAAQWLVEHKSAAGEDAGLDAASVNEQMMNVYESFTGLIPIRTVADKYQGKIDALKGKYNRQIQDIRSKYSQELDELKKKRAEDIRAVRQQMQEKSEARQKAVMEDFAMQKSDMQAAREDTRIMEREFIRLAREYEKAEYDLNLELKFV